MPVEVRPYDRSVKIVKRYDPVRDPSATEFIPVARAAALLHDRVFPGFPVKEAQTLDLLAMALAEVIPTYLRDPDTGKMRVLDKGVIARGQFTRGATRLDFGDGHPLRFLLVSRKELVPAIEALATDPASPVLKMSPVPQPGAQPSARAA